jgi:hypothetical protein
MTIITSSHPSSSLDDSIPIPTMIRVLPLPSTELPPSRPYTAVTMASARTSTTQVDLDVPPFLGSIGGTQRDGSQTTSRSGSGSGIVQREAGIETEVVPQMPQTSLTFLLVSGRRRTMSFDPDTTVGRVKELVWNAWPSGESLFSSLESRDGWSALCIPGGRAVVLQSPFLFDDSTYFRTIDD